VSPAFVAILLLPVAPLFIGVGLVVYVAQRRGVKLNTLFPAFFSKVIGWGFLVAFAFVVFVIVATAIASSPQGPLLLLFISVPFAVGEIVGLVLWGRKIYAT
jgi:hypothetical protein